MPAISEVNKKEVTCQQMAALGKCSRGDRCPWGHSVVGPIKRTRSPSAKGDGKGKKGKNKDKGEKTPKKPDPSAATKATTGTSPSGKPNRPVCRYYKKGTCKRGDKCDNYHVPSASSIQIVVVEAKHASMRTMTKPDLSQSLQSRKEPWQ